MKEFIDKLISRLEEVAIETLGINKSQFAMDKGEYSSYCSLSLCEVKEKANQLAEEYNNESVKGDLISRSALLKQFAEVTPYGCGTVGIKFVDELIKNQPTAYNDDWIPCSERLPIDEEYIIRSDGVEFYKHMLTTTNDVDSPICVGWYDREEETWFDLEGFAFYPIAWQPLPPKFEPKD